MNGTCPSCAQPVAPADTFCGSCGAPLRPAGPVTPQSAQYDDVLGTAARPPEPRWPADDRGRSDSSWPARAGSGALSTAALGQAAPNANRMGYERTPEPSFDPLVNRSLLTQFLLHWLVYLLTYLAGGVVAGIGALLLGAIGLGFGTASKLWVIGAVIVGGVMLCMYWFVPVPALLSEWKILVDTQAAAAPTTFDHIAWAVGQHQTPLDGLQVRRLKLAGGEGRDYLELRRGLFTGFISCFAYGQDLYVGWTFWLQISPFRWVLMALARLWQTLARRGSDLYVTLRFDSAKAMREAMHSVAREGVDVAIGQLRAQGQGTMALTQVAVTELDV
jgi:hypothetical protein